MQPSAKGLRWWCLGLVLTCAAAPVDVRAQDAGCTPVPPACAAVDRKAQPYIDRQTAAATSARMNAAAAAAAAYCGLSVSIEVMNYCAAVYQNAGRSSCAAQADRQAEEFRTQQQHFLQVFKETSAVSNPDVSAQCGF